MYNYNTSTLSLLRARETVFHFSWKLVKLPIDALRYSQLQAVRERKGGRDLICVVMLFLFLFFS